MGDIHQGNVVHRPIIVSDRLEFLKEVQENILVRVS
jgi:hypothetical protein